MCLFYIATISLFQISMCLNQPKNVVSPATNPCNALACRPEQQCDIDRFGIARCECGPPCPAVMRPVCGADGITYDSHCDASRQACLAGRPAPSIAHPGPCGLRGPCHGHRCSHREARCVVRASKPSCECPSCPEEFEPVCGTDGISYTNECKLRREACEHSREVSVAHTGLCGKFLCFPSLNALPTRSQRASGCDKKRCDFHAVCEEDGQCVCPRTCVKVDAPVCGTDGVTYPSECELRVAACNKGELVMVASRGQCDQCLHVRCKHGARCDKGMCVCPTSCPEDKREPLCANDGATYPNECEMRRTACQASRELRVLFYGECDDVGAAQAEAGSGQADCEADDKCRQFGGRCTSEGCDCDLGCPSQQDPVCGSSNRLYDNDCMLREDMCRLQVHIQVVSMDRCMPAKIMKFCDDQKMEHKWSA
ncbi:hypothetical protein LAZ67_15002578 [Cordylochernes scorpioides]|uniref:Kazal-like domain-containing protein n=1 Tax=Cordylochernes scorpioides TaxID=51811 RepID=A0ABY6LC99_9ARAC|nr:hypothetical protein LAZ67_15002578 [Cordylochernes scorpioides]